MSRIITFAGHGYTTELMTIRDLNELYRRAYNVAALYTLDMDDCAAMINLLETKFNTCGVERWRNRFNVYLSLKSECDEVIEQILAELDIRGEDALHPDPFEDE